MVIFPLRTKILIQSSPAFGGAGLFLLSKAGTLPQKSFNKNKELKKERKWIVSKDMPDLPPVRVEIIP
jgi:hypothetical protein